MHKRTLSQIFNRITYAAILTTIIIVSVEAIYWTTHFYN